MRYLDPKNDLVFKKIFGEHPDLLISFLNALLPLPKDDIIEEIEYQSPEQVPEIPGLKNSIVDVKCKDNRGRQFIVEMQMLWTDSFLARVLFNASKAFVRQLSSGEKYEILKPVYALSLVNENFIPDPDKFYHHYAIVNSENNAYRLDGLEFVFVELAKFKGQSFSDKKMAALWLRFMTEIKDRQEGVSEELYNNKEIRKALDILQESAFTLGELEYYDRLWDAVSKERTLISERTAKAMKQGREEGHKEGLEEGREEGIDIGLEKGIRLTAIKLIENGSSDEFIAQITGLTISQIQELRKEIEK